MSFWYKADLKIEFRAVPFSSDSHHLEYRISPNQDLTFETEHSFLGIKFKRKRKFSTKWRGAYHYLNYPSAYLYEESHNYNPILLNDKKELIEYQNKFKTIGAFYDYVNKWDQKEKAEWLKERQEYLKRQGIWE